MKVVLLSAVLLCLFACSDTTGPDETVSMTIELQHDTISEGEDAYLKILIEKCEHTFNGISLRIGFDEEYLELESESVQNSNEIFGENTLKFIESENGVVYLSYVCEAGTTITGNSGLIGTIVFESKLAGVTELELLPGSLIFYNENGEQIENEIKMDSSVELVIN